jgi:3-hydroxybutyryl-CoA dehydrogenase
VKTYVCPQCHARYSVDLPSCTFCRVDLVLDQAREAEVIAVTEVQSPPLGHEDVPYWVAMVRTPGGALHMRKSDTALMVGDRVLAPEDEAIERAVVGVLGTGVMGRGLVELLLSRGHMVRWHGRTEQSIGKARARVFDRLGRVMDEDQLAAVEPHLVTSTDVSVLGDCDVVIEAVVEELEPKAAALAEAEAAMRDDAVLATNTSGLSLDDLAAALKRPERFGALHFFNPATRMRLVETAVARATSPETSAFLDEFAASLAKTPVRVSATPAFAVNRALMPLLNEAVREFEEGVASAESIDEAIRLGLNHPMGPLALADLIGLDVVIDIMDNLAERLGDETYTPRPLLRTLVAEGKLGRKTGAGFYEYPAIPR